MSFVTGPGFGGWFSSTTVLPSRTSDTVNHVPWSFWRSSLPGSWVANNSPAVRIKPLAIMRISPCKAPSDLVLSVRVVLHGADDVAFRVAEEDQMSDGWDHRPRDENGAAVRHHGGGHGVHVGNRDGAFEADHALPRHELAPLLEGAPDAGIAFGAGKNLEEAGGTPGLEAPGEDAFVETARPVHVVGVDGEVGDVRGRGLGHGRPILSSRSEEPRERRYDMPLPRYALTLY